MTVRPLYGLKLFSTTIARYINDLPITSPHGSDFGDDVEIWDFQVIQMGNMAHQRHSVAHWDSRPYSTLKTRFQPSW